MGRYTPTYIAERPRPRVQHRSEPTSIEIDSGVRGDSTPENSTYENETRYFRPKIVERESYPIQDHQQFRNQTHPSQLQTPPRGYYVIIWMIFGPKPSPRHPALIYEGTLCFTCHENGSENCACVYRDKCGTS